MGQPFNVNVPLSGTYSTADLEEYGILSGETFISEINRNNLDLKNFCKKDNMPTQGTGTLLNWYRRLTPHGLRHGVFIPPFESLAITTKMGL